MPGFNITLVQKITLTDKVYLFTFVADTVAYYKPGQFVSLETYPKVYRAYSIAYLATEAPKYVKKIPKIDTTNSSYLSLIISTKPGGLASGYFESVSIGTKMKVLNISGRFGLKLSNNPKCFVCTGTGLVPFISMINQALEFQPTGTIKLFVGALKKEQDFSYKFFDILQKPNFELYSCIDGEVVEESNYTKNGRVTEIVPKIVKNIIDNDYYLCGNPFMILDMEQKLFDLGVPKNQVFKEAFGSIRKIS